MGTAALGAGRWGQLDLAGDVWEWNLDWYATGGAYYPCTDCAYLTTSNARVIRGGNFKFDPSDLLPWTRYFPAADGSLRRPRLSLRCERPERAAGAARAPEPLERGKRPLRPVVLVRRKARMYTRQALRAGATLATLGGALTFAMDARADVAEGAHDYRGRLGTQTIAVHLERGGAG